ncbi:MAG: flagellin [Gemmatimonadales bacterium]|nr:flagellin [Gemmatimonadales bacterium]MDZ4388971.1 flagellin [Gemmatimonadales bacterium]
MSVIQTNTAANAAFRNLSVSNAGLERQITRLSSGFRINKSSDDAAGLAIANKLRAESRSLQVAQRNAAQGISLLQIADGAVNTISGALDRLKELASQSNSDTIGSQRDKVDAEFQQIISEIGRIARTTQYQGAALVDGSFGSAVDTGASTVLAVAGVTSVQVSGAQTGTFTLTSAVAGELTLSNAAGTLTQTVTNVAGAQTLDFSAFGIKVQTGGGFVADSAVGDIVIAGGTGNFMVSSSGDFAGDDLISLTTLNLTTGATGLNLDGLDILSSGNAQTALTRIDLAIDAANSAIGTIGATQSRLELAAANVATVTQNVIAAESTIRDADLALESTTFTKFQILQQAGIAVLAQANSSSQSVLSLLQ